MKLNDRLYGAVAITSPVLIKLINSQALRRLKGIGQYGIPDDYYHLKNYSRYEHSLGVMLLLKKIGAGELEQIAGLIHDVSHTAFSHLVDWVLESSGTESFQDEHHLQILKDSDVRQILTQYGYSLDQVSDYHPFSLLEQDLPNLCADRIDYALREIPATLAREIVPHLTTYKHQIVFDNQQSAQLFALEFLKRQTCHWGGFEAASRYRLFANILKQAMDLGIITLNDFWQDDACVMQKILLSKNKKLISQLEKLTPKSLANLPKSQTIVHKKFRYVDPACYAGGHLCKLSDVSETFRNQLKKAKEINQQGVCIPVL
jgi:uncharacterized protein